MAISAALRGAGLGLAPLAVWWLLGPHRRGELFRGVRTREGCRRRSAPAGACRSLLWQPWNSADDTQEAQREWEPLETFMAGFPLPPEAAGIEIRTSPTTTQTQRLIQSAVDTFEKSKDFYDGAAADAADLDLREPERGRDGRHRRQRSSRQHRHGPGGSGDRGAWRGNGRPRRRGRHLDRPAVGGVQPRLARPRLPGPRPLRGRPATTTTAPSWTTTSTSSAGRCSTGPGWRRRGAVMLLGVDDPRSSGLGNWRDETGPELQRGRGASGRRGLRRRSSLDHPGARRQPRARGARPRLRRPRRRRSHARPGRARPRSRVRTRPSATRSPTARPAERRTPSPSAASRDATPTSRSSPTATVARSAPRRCACGPTGCSWSSPTSSSPSPGATQK